VKAAVLPSRAHVLGGTIPFLASICVGSRAFFFAVGAAGHAYIGQAVPGGLTIPSPGVLDYWAHWDGAWYVAIATRGYYNDAAHAFLPLYPRSIAVLAHLPGGPALWGVVISTIAFCAATFFLYELAQDLFDRDTARATALVFAFFPTAFFFNAVYTEALFVALAAGAVWALRVRSNLVLALVFSFFAAETRNVGILILIPVAYDALVRQRRRPLTTIPALLLSASGFAAWLFFLWWRYGTPFYFQRVNAQIWGRRFAAPWHTVARAWHQAVHGAGYAVDPARVFAAADGGPAFRVAAAVDLAALVLAVVLLAVAWRRLPVELWVYSIVVLVPAVITPSPILALMSMSRYVLAAFPLFIVLGRLVARGSIALPAWTAASAAIGAYLTLLFTTWRWVA
jgi:hypothetical protein